MAKVPTFRVESKNVPGGVIIAATDYDPEQHVLIEENPTKEQPEARLEKPWKVSEVVSKADTVRALAEAGYVSANDFAGSTPTELAQVEGVGAKTAERLIGSAKKHLKS